MSAQITSAGTGAVSPGALRLPEANEFSPGQIDLHKVLRLVARNEGNREAIRVAIRAEFFSEAAKKQPDSQQRLKQQRTRAYNVLVGLKGYGLMDFETDRLTSAGTSLLKANSKKARLEEFASHILKNCHGLDVLKAVRSIQSRAEKASKESLAEELRSLGFKLPRATTHHTKLLQWLRAAGVVDDKNNPDEEAVAKLTGVGLAEMEEWSGLTRPQKALLRTLRELADAQGTSLITAKYVVDLSELQHGQVFRSDQLRAQVFRPLETAGWIRLGKVGPGRGGKSGQIGATQKLIDFDLKLLTTDVETLPTELLPLMNRPLADIFDDLKSSDTHAKGIALELLSVRIARALGLTPIWLRERSAETHGAEVDLVAEGAQLKFSRWLFQCKNTPNSSVALSALAKEVGMAFLLHAHVIVMVTTGRFTESVADHAKSVAETTALQVVLVDKKVLRDFHDRGPEAVLDFFRDAAAGTMRLKRIQISRAESA